jgi:hypothetical protein
MNRREAKVFLKEVGTKRGSTFANTIYVYCRDIKISIPAKNGLQVTDTLQRNDSENSISKSQAGQRHSPQRSSGRDLTMEAWPRPEPRLKAGHKAAQHWNWTQRPFHRDPTPQDAGSALAFCPQLEPRPAPGQRTPDTAELRHATPVRACTSLTQLVFQPLRRNTRMLAPQQRSTSQANGSSSARPRRICLSNSSALRVQMVNLPSHLQRKTRQTIYIIVIDICSFRSWRIWQKADMAEAITTPATTWDRPGQRYPVLEIQLRAKRRECERIDAIQV